MPQITTDEHQHLISRFRQIYSVYQDHRDLIAVGAYQKGSDSRVDESIERWPAMMEFVRQHQNERVDVKSSINRLRQLVEGSTPVTSAATDE